MNQDMQARPPPQMQSPRVMPALRQTAVQARADQPERRGLCLRPAARKGNMLPPPAAPIQLIRRTREENLEQGLHAPVSDAHQGTRSLSQNTTDGGQASRNAAAQADPAETSHRNNHAAAPGDALATAHEMAQAAAIAQAEQPVHHADEIQQPLVLPGFLNGCPAGFLLDSGAAANLMNPVTAERLQIQLTQIAAIKVVLAHGSESTCTKQARGVNLTLGHGESLFETVMNFFVPDMPRSQHEAVLGMPFLAGINPTVDWRRHVTAVPASRQTSGGARTGGTTTRN